MELRLPPKMPKELLKEAHARFEEVIASLKAMPADTPAGLLAFFRAAGEVVAALEYDRCCSALFRRFGRRTIHDLAKGLGETRPTLFACAALHRTYTADELDEIAGRASSAEELAKLVCLEDPEADKCLRKRLLSSKRRTRRGRSRTDKQGRQARRQAGQDDRGNGDVAGV